MAHWCAPFNLKHTAESMLDKARGSAVGVCATMLRHLVASDTTVRNDSIIKKRKDKCISIYTTLRHILEEREGLGNTELQNTGEKEALVHYLNTGKQEAKASFIATSLLMGPTSKPCRGGGSSPTTRHPRHTGGYFYVVPSGLQQSLLTSEQNACQNKETTYTVLTGRQKEQKVLLKHIAEKTDLHTITYMLKQLWILPLHSSPL